MKHLVSSLVAATALAGGTAGAAPIDFGKELFEMPQTAPAPVTFTLPAGVKTTFMTGPQYNGAPTKIFACYGVPASRDGKPVPGVILLHGSGGTAFSRWVALWNARGYAAIAVDYHGRMPVGAGWNKHTGSKVIDGGGPQESARYTMGVPEKESFTYHAVAAVLMAHSVLAAQPGVDAGKIGLIGVSMGGVLATRVAGIDPRLKFAVAVYGCGNLMRGTVFGDRSKRNYKMTDEGVREYIEKHDPVVYFKNASCPMLFVNNTNDPFFRTLPWDNTIKAGRNMTFQSLRMNLRHSHVDSDVPEVRLFADWNCGKTAELPHIAAPVKLDGKLGAAVYGRRPAQWNAELVWTADPGYGTTRKWQSSPASFNAAGNQLEAELPENCRSAFFRISRKDGAGFSSPLFVL